nr:immunoglobulin heavy chain junction region [Macaca mulatta]MOV51626.1 immunoglobulin heavy chain junction region [Macaca mulatta]MOV51954.1 immunoglobulin heavy chain junction region [Macaca mulatta]MOV53016.1 immunoglobulin heavy chain junction region [Macaca mulatta]
CARIRGIQLWYFDLW